MKDQFNLALVDWANNMQEAADEIIETLTKKQIKLCELETVFKIVSRKISKQVIQKAE